MKTKLVMIRHGETESNKRGAYLGCRSDEPLSEQGRAEAEALAGKLSGILTGEICWYASPMKRAVETARILMGGAGELRIEPLLKEIDFGLFDGKNHAELDGDPRYQAWIDSGATIAFPEGESRDSFIARSMEGLKAVLERTDPASGQTIVLICHGGTIMSLMSALNGGDYYDYRVSCLDGYIAELEKHDTTLSILTFTRLRDRLYP